jgi:GTP-binding protein Era
MPGEEVPAQHRSGFVAVVGRPNVGKSTLINRLLQQNVAAVSARPQTTLRRQLGILTLPHAQAIFVDTPGIHKPHHKLGEAMNLSAEEALADSDALLVLFDLSHPPSDDDRRVADRVHSLPASPPILIGMNKMDLLDAETLAERMAQYEALLPGKQSLPISATRGDNCEELLHRLVELLPQGPRYYPADEITDIFERDIAADLIRAAALDLLRDEVPHCIAVRIDDYKERDEHGAFVRATLFVERESQKGIVIGKQGSMLREIGTRARLQIEQMSGRKVYLELRVKVLPRWRNDVQALRRLGYRVRGN